MIYEDSCRLFDVVIVGAGPAGSSCAIRLALAGLKVLLVEKHKFPREKLCGEFISPECLRHFWELGITPEAISRKLERYFAGLPVPPVSSQNDEDDDEA